mmetsp:Transcript_119519/g.338248  ORF Transcript_119519/g.338248 Transcript_119519/m.338248 type:complete len:85 (-) Transcript_119519:1347-1601(-)
MSPVDATVDPEATSRRRARHSTNYRCTEQRAASGPELFAPDTKSTAFPKPQQCWPRCQHIRVASKNAPSNVAPLPMAVNGCRDT